MLHPGDIEWKLGFDQIREKLKAQCLCSLGASAVDAMTFQASAVQISRMLNENWEFRQLLERYSDFPSNHYFDPTSLLATATVDGAYLEPADFLRIKQSLETIVSCIAYLTIRKNDFPSLFNLATPVHVNPEIIKEINRIIDEEGLVKDSASDELKKTRKLLREAQTRLRTQIEKAYRMAVAEQWVPEGGLPSIRQGRLAIPVLAEFKRKLKGYILDESATGQTVYIEPVEAIEVNNEIRDLEHAAQREVIRILKDLTSMLRMHIDDLKEAYRFLGYIDFTRARAMLSITLDATLPQVKDVPVLHWINARHPLLQFTLTGQRTVIPLTINLTNADRMLLISGPNAGGKSVCLKTVGLLQYMLQCGLLIPVSADSTAGIFNDMFIDIGDQQSIENDLSTYSSHLKNLAFFIEHSGPQSLVLLDELGSGTDPNFGGAIAEAVLETLLDKKVWAVATTHYYNLKLFAGNRPGIRNGAMRFDEQNLTPLFILDIGKPGSSFALEVARKTGIPAEVLEKAGKLVGKELMGFDSIVRTLEKEKHELAEKLNRLAIEQRQLEESIQQYNYLRNDLEQHKKKILDRAKQDAAALLQQTNREIEKTIRHIRENQAQRSETKKVRRNLQQIAKRVTEQHSQLPGSASGKIQPGDVVSIIGQEGAGTVLSIKGKHAQVQFGELKSKVPIVKLQKAGRRLLTDGAVPSGKPATGGLKLYEKQATFNPLLDVRGKRAEEVIPLLDEFLDTALLLGYRQLKILHGKGEGVLRTVVRSELKKSNHVETFVDEHVDRGGAGITVVVLK
ncbi:MAG: Smr/MutS family protein [Cyclobacteriaceae bacterium]|nr:Smr/MutS family protein [Cyclobacteriaceae bacterium]